MISLSQLCHFNIIKNLLLDQTNSDILLNTGCWGDLGASGDREFKGQRLKSLMITLGFEVCREISTNTSTGWFRWCVYQGGSGSVCVLADMLVYVCVWVQNWKSCMSILSYLHLPCLTKPSLKNIFTKPLNSGLVLIVHVFIHTVVYGLCVKISKMSAFQELKKPALFLALRLKYVWVYPADVERLSQANVYLNWSYDSD